MKFDNFYYTIPSRVYPNGTIVIKNDVWNYFASVSYTIFNILNRRVNKYIPAVLEISPSYAEEMDLVTMNKNDEDIAFVLGLTTGVGHVTLFLNAILFGIGRKDNSIDHDKAVTLIYTAIYHELVHCDQNILSTVNDMDVLIAVEEEAEYRSYKSVFANEYLHEMRKCIPNFNNFSMAKSIENRAVKLIEKYDSLPNFCSDYRFRESGDVYEYIFDGLIDKKTMDKYPNAIIIIIDSFNNNEAWRFDIKANNVYITESLNFLSYVLRNTIFKGVNMRSECHCNYIIGTPIDCKLCDSCRMATNQYVHPYGQSIIYGIHSIKDYIPICDVYEESQFPDLSQI